MRAFQSEGGHLCAFCHDNNGRGEVLVPVGQLGTAMTLFPLAMAMPEMFASTAATICKKWAPGGVKEKAMTQTRPLMTPHAAQKLTVRLARLRGVSRFDQPGEPQSATLAHCLTDLETSFREVLENLLPNLLDETLTDEQINDVLLDIGEELRHIVYHINDPGFFEYLKDEQKGG